MTRPRSTSGSSLRLLSEFQLLVDGRQITLPHSVERVLAFLGISQVPVSRTRLAGSLWPTVADQRANGDLRSALWRLRRIAGVIDEQNHRLSLAPEVDVDIAEMTDLTRALIAEPESPALDRVADLVRAHALLPGWDDEWLIVERERYRMSRLRALERSSRALLAARDFAGALDAALASVATEPYRETAHRLVIQIHLAEGNRAQAIRAYQSYRLLVADELGIVPSPLMRDLVAPLSMTVS
ncbi:MAG TPA: BTAD domain-containing putative transcriptional regulator [Jiangellales bacterium]|nr:BTAD domain-containing putative transcriptional regulator [Jiangellales bacterium]